MLSSLPMQARSGRGTRRRAAPRRRADNRSGGALPMWRIFGTRWGGGETDLLADRLRLSAAEARRLAAEGDWVDIAEGAVLTEEGVRPEALIFLVSGEIDVLRLGAPVARCGRGNFIGEMAMLE